MKPPETAVAVEEGAVAEAAAAVEAGAKVEAVADVGVRWCCVRDLDTNAFNTGGFTTRGGTEL